MVNPSLREFLRPALVIALGFVCASCAVGPDFNPPQPQVGAAYSPSGNPQLRDDQRIQVADQIRRDWWTAFRSAALDELVARAFRANPTIESAQAALRVAQENVAAQRGFFYPNLGAGYSFARTKQGGTVPATSTPTPANVPATAIYDFHSAQLTVGFAPDVFGGNRRQLEGLQATADMQRFQLEAAYLTLATNVVGAAIQDGLLRAQLALVRETIAAGEKSLGLVQRQWRAGAVAHLDVALQESALAQVRQQLFPLEKQLGQNQDLLRVLLGLPQDAQVPEFQLDALHLPEDLPLVLPARLVERRPDLRAALEQLHAASAQIGVARAARLPQFSISGDLGGGASRIADLFSTGGSFFSFVAGIMQPVFDGGTLRHREGAARAAYDQAAAQYRASVITALQNVADALHAIQADGGAYQAASTGAEATRTALELTRRQYGHGYLDRLALINAEQASRQAELSLLQARATRLGDASTLMQALGGGWQSTEKEAP